MKEGEGLWNSDLMSDPYLLVLAVLAKGQLTKGQLAKQQIPPPPIQPTPRSPQFNQSTQTKLLLQQSWAKSITKPQLALNYQTAARVTPQSGTQLYHQRVAALQAGKLYTRLAIDSFHQIWRKAVGEQSYEQWRWLLMSEAQAVAKGQGNNRLAVIVGDSLSLWFPSDRLPQTQLWLNQAISGDNTTGILRRLSDFAATRPDTIYVMAGINDLKQGATDQQVLWNLHQIMERLRQIHPQARVVVQSLLPTRDIPISNSRIQHLNQRLRAIVQHNGATYLDLHSQLQDETGQLHQDLTTDGLHLSQQGYAAWQSALWQAELTIANAKI